MGHRATVYSIFVHTKRRTNELKPLGNIDGKGTYLGDVIQSYLDDFSGGNADGSRHVHCATPVLDGEYIFLPARHGQSGLAADIVNSDGETEFHQRPEHEHVLPCASLFYLPREQVRGWWVAHINNGRSAKGLLQSQLVKRFREDFGEAADEHQRGLTLKVEPVVNKSALDAAVAQNRLEKVKLRRLRNPRDIAEVGRWIPTHASPLVGLEIASEGKGARLIPEPIKRFLTGADGALDEIVEFGGLTFEEASATIVLPNGKTRTINIQAREGGAAISQDLDGLTTVDGDPTPESLEAELRRSLRVTIGQT